MADGAEPADRAGMWVDDEVPEGGYYKPGWTAIMLAARGGYSEVVKALVEHGASVCDRGQVGDTALLFPCIDNDVETMSVLLAHGAKLDEVCYFRRFDEELGWHLVGTPLHAAANSGCGCVEATRCLLGHGAAVESRLSPCGRTPLLYASARGHAQVIDVLLRAGADPNQREQRPVYGYEIDHTPLHYAARKGDLASVRLLLEAGADPTAVVVPPKETAGQLAEASDHHDVAEFIAACSAKRT